VLEKTTDRAAYYHVCVCGVGIPDRTRLKLPVPVVSTKHFKSGKEAMNKNPVQAWQNSACPVHEHPSCTNKANTRRRTMSLLVRHAGTTVASCAADCARKRTEDTHTLPLQQLRSIKALHGQTRTCREPHSLTLCTFQDQTPVAASVARMIPLSLPTKDTPAATRMQNQLLLLLELLLLVLCSAQHPPRPAAAHGSCLAA
jgi:hypothetical protein